ncbi:MAG TPA: cytochrome C [Anaerolineae bacterium]|nr:cytochrome C [Anaerolineae bacterium]
MRFGFKARCHLALRDEEIPPVWSWQTVLRVLFLAMFFLLGSALWLRATPDSLFAASPPPLSSDEACLSCHGDPGLEIQLPDGQTWSLYVSSEAHQVSVHGQVGVRCLQCHQDIDGYPHPPLTATSVRDFQLQSYNLCQSCHEAEYGDDRDHIHARMLADGNQKAATCTDCHTAHSINRTRAVRQQSVIACSKCHAAISEAYRRSVHGTALLVSDNPDVPTCSDCHAVHHPVTLGTERVPPDSPLLCARCHANARLMQRYGLTPTVFETYLDDFHGQAFALQSAPSAPSVEQGAACVDCHGVHDIRSATDPASSVAPANLQATCQRCHPGATVSFTTTWGGHLPPTSYRSRLVYYIDRLYRLLIGLSAGGVALFILADGTRRITRRQQQ